MSCGKPRVESFAPLRAGAPESLAHGFVGRVPGLEVQVDREEAVRRLEPFHRVAAEEAGWDWERLRWAEQVHGAEVAVVGRKSGMRRAPGADGLLTADPGLLLAILVADCCAVYLMDLRLRVLGLLHAGRKGTERGILPRAVEVMGREFGTDPSDLLIQLSPCIRPPAYEVDIPEMLVGQARAAGVPAERIHDCGICTAQHPDRYYSYRRERGRTGRMLAFAGWREPGGGGGEVRG